jgi:hypothetical protein
MRTSPYNTHVLESVTDKFNHDMYAEFLELINKRQNTIANAVNSLDIKKIKRVLKSILIKIGFPVSRLTSTELTAIQREMEMLYNCLYDGHYSALQKVVILNKYYDFDTDDIGDTYLKSCIDNTILLNVLLSKERKFNALPLSNTNTEKNETNINNLNRSSKFNGNMNLHKMTNVQRVSMWTTNSYQRIQNARRNVSASPPNTGSILINQGISTVMTKLAYKAPYMPRGIGKKPKYLYRGVHGNFVLQLLLSGEFREKGYIPFTRNPLIADGFATSQISFRKPMPYATLKIHPAWDAFTWW